MLLEDFTKFTHLIFPTALGDRHYDYTHLTDEDIDT